MDHLDSKNLMPFKRRRNEYHLPRLGKEAEDKIIDDVDPELRPEEQGYVRHFLGYADVMLKNAELNPEQEASSAEGEAPENEAMVPPQETIVPPPEAVVPPEKAITPPPKNNVIEVPRRKEAAEIVPLEEKASGL